MQKISITFAAGLLCFTFFGCVKTSTTPPPMPPKPADSPFACLVDADCEPSNICWQKQCRPMCEPGEEGLSECPEGFVCALQGFCVEESTVCNSDEECADDQQCDSGLCVEKSLEDSEESNQNAANNEEGSAQIDEQLQACLQNTHRVFFAFDQSLLQDSDLPTLQEVSQCLQQYDLQVTLHAHTDHWGSSQYNMALADKRGQAAKGYLASLMPNASISVLSFGSEKPLRQECCREACSQRTCDVYEEACAQNRRCDIILQVKEHAEQPADENLKKLQE